MTLSFLQKVGLSFFGGGLEFFENGQKISLVKKFWLIFSNFLSFCSTCQTTPGAALLLTSKWLTLGPPSCPPGYPCSNVAGRTAVRAAPPTHSAPGAWSQTPAWPEPPPSATSRSGGAGKGPPPPLAPSSRKASPFSGSPTTSLSG